MHVIQLSSPYWMLWITLTSLACCCAFYKLHRSVISTLRTVRPRGHNDILIWHILINNVLGLCTNVLGVLWVKQPWYLIHWTEVKKFIWWRQVNISQLYAMQVKVSFVYSFGRDQFKLYHCYIIRGTNTISEPFLLIGWSVILNNWVIVQHIANVIISWQANNGEYHI